MSYTNNKTMENTDEIDEYCICAAFDNSVPKSFTQMLELGQKLVVLRDSDGKDNIYRRCTKKHIGTKKEITIDEDTGDQILFCHKHYGLYKDNKDVLIFNDILTEGQIIESLNDPCLRRAHELYERKGTWPKRDTNRFKIYLQKSILESLLSEIPELRLKPSAIKKERHVHTNNSESKGSLLGKSRIFIDSNENPDLDNLDYDSKCTETNTEQPSQVSDNDSFIEIPEHVKEKCKEMKKGIVKNNLEIIIHDPNDTDSDADAETEAEAEAEAEAEGKSEYLEQENVIYAEYPESIEDSDDDDEDDEEGGDIDDEITTKNNVKLLYCSTLNIVFNQIDGDEIDQDDMIGKLIEVNEEYSDLYYEGKEYIVAKKKIWRERACYVSHFTQMIFDLNGNFIASLS